MSLGVVFKSAEGIVLAADSRVTLTAARNQGQGGPTEIVPAFYDNATKLLRVNGQTHVGVVTYGLGALGTAAPRTAHSFMPEFEAALYEDEVGRLTVEDFAKRLSSFFVEQWQANMPTGYNGPDLAFLIGGYNKDEAYGRVYEVFIPNRPDPLERHPGAEFGVTWGGQREYVDRLIRGFDDSLPTQTQTFQKLSDDERQHLFQEIAKTSQLPIPFQFLPLQDCVDLTIFLIRMTITLQKWLVGIRGVGGAIDVATITRTEGYSTIQQKEIRGEEVP